MEGSNAANMQNQATNLTLRSSSYAAGASDEYSNRGNLSSRNSSVSNKGKRMKRDDLDSLSHSSKKRAGPLQDITNSMSMPLRVPAFQNNGKASSNSTSRVTRSMTSSDRKSGKARDSCDTVQNKSGAIKATANGCSASTTRKISQSFAQASINEAANVATTTASLHGHTSSNPGAGQPLPQPQANQEGGLDLEDTNNNTNAAASNSAPAAAQAAAVAPLRAGAGGALAGQPVQGSTRLWKDIDAPVRGDMRMCTDYVNDVYTNAQIKQLKHSPNPHYMELHQREITITMRGILVDWLVEVAVEYQQSQETLFLSVGYIDAYLSKARCMRSKLQLVGITCMHIASKYQEIYPPQLQEFCYITDNTYEREDLILMERRVLDVLDFELSVPTTWMFLTRFLRVAEADRQTEYLGMYLAELSLLDYGLLQFLPSQIAASCVMLALNNNNKSHWSTTLEHYTGYTPRALRECATVLHRLHAGARTSTLPAISEKYAKEKLDKVSDLPVREVNFALYDQTY